MAESSGGGRPDAARLAAVDASLAPNTANYSLPGVLFFLQSQWRKAEREKTSWELERAELKSRISVLEGENKAVQAFNSDLQRRVKMLEMALKQERSKSLQQEAQGQQQEQQQAPPQASLSTTIVPRKEPAVLESTTTPTQSTLSLDGNAAPGASSSAETNQQQQLESQAPRPPIVLKYSKGNGASRSKELLSSYIKEAAALTGTDSADMIAEFRRLQQLKQSFIPTQAYSMPPEEIEALAERQRAAAEEEAAIAANARGQSTRAPGMIPASELRSAPAPSDPDLVVGAAPLPAASSSTSSASQEDEVEDESDDEALDSRSEGSTVARSRTVKRIGRTNGSAVAADDPNSKIVMSKFVEYEAGKKRGVLSKVRELRKAQAESQGQQGSDGETSGSSRELHSSPLESSPTEIDETQRVRLRFALRSHLAGIRTTSWHPTENVLFSGSEDATAKMWNLQPPVPGRKLPLDIEPSFTFRGHQLPVLSLAVCNDAEGQDRLFTSSADSAIYSWSLPDPRRDPYAPYHDVRARQFALVGHTDAVWSLAAHPYYRNSPLLVSCSADGTAKIWNDLDLAHTLRRPGLEPVSSSWIKVAPARVAVGYDDGSITLWDAFQGKEIQTFQPARAQIDALVSHATMPLLFAGCGDGTVRAIDVNSGEEAWSEELHEGGVTCLDVNPDGLTLASGGYDGNLVLTDLSRRTAVERVNTGCGFLDEAIWSVAYANVTGTRGPRQTRGLAVGGADGIVRVYEV